MGQQSMGLLDIGAAVVKGIGQISQGAGEAAAYQANSRAAIQQAEVARQQSYMKAAQVERQVSETMGEQQAGFGHAGVTPNLWLLADSARQGAMAKATELYQGRLEASSQQRKADIEHAQATAARTGSYLSAAGTVLSAVAGKAAGEFVPSMTTTIPGAGGSLDMPGIPGAGGGWSADLTPQAVSLSTGGSDFMSFLGW
jgi:hypothetical protein